MLDPDSDSHSDRNADTCPDTGAGKILPAERKCDSDCGDFGGGDHRGGLRDDSDPEQEGNRGKDVPEGQKIRPGFSILTLNPPSHVYTAVTEGALRSVCQITETRKPRSSR